MMDYTRYLKRTALAFVALLALPLGLVLYVDPFQVYHRPFIAGMGLVENQRFQNAGLINSYLADAEQGYDAVMIGSSVSDNFSSADAATHLGWHKSLRLFFDGGDPAQLAFMLEQALQRGHVQHVLWEILPRNYSPPHYSPEANLQDREFPAYLYNRNPFDDLHYLFNADVLALAWRHGVLKQDLPQATPESLGYWAERPYAAPQHIDLNRPERIEEERARYRGAPTLAGTPAAAMGTHSFPVIDFPVIDKVVLPLLQRECGGEREFVLFIPPVSRLDYLGNPRYVWRSLQMTRHLLAGIANCPNIRLHAFGQLDFTGDLNYYHDKIHYRLAVSHQLLAWMGQGHYRLDLANYPDYEAAFIRGIDGYQPHSSYPAELPPLD